MNINSSEELRCVLVGEQKLPQEVGGQEAVCSAIRDAAAPVLQQAGIPARAVSISIQVKSEYLISAATTVRGRDLSEQKVGISDRPLNRRAINMLANAVAAELSKLDQQ